jgi:hypothetical protein
MSSLVGALLFARAIDDPVQSDAMLQFMRRQLREQFCRPPTHEARTKVPSVSHDFIRAF